MFTSKWDSALFGEGNAGVAGKLKDRVCAN